MTAEIIKPLNPFEISTITIQANEAPLLEKRATSHEILEYLMQVQEFGFQIWSQSTFVAMTSDNEGLS